VPATLASASPDDEALGAAGPGRVHDHHRTARPERNYVARRARFSSEEYWQRLNRAGQ
jgi:hypothetical protein